MLVVLQRVPLAAKSISARGTDWPPRSSETVNAYRICQVIWELYVDVVHLSLPRRSCERRGRVNRIQGAFKISNSGLKCQCRSPYVDLGIYLFTPD